MWQVWDSPAVRAGRVRLPRPFACDAADGIAWQEGLAGRPLLKQRAPSTRLPGLAFEIGERLAALHGSGTTLPIKMTHAFQLAMLRDSLASAPATLPPAARTMGELGEHLLALGARFEPLPAVTLHGSFRLSHVMETPDGVAFIDLDGANAGDPAVDLGRFLSHLHRLEAQRTLDPKIAGATAREFVRGYRASAPVTVSDERIGWATAVHLVSGGLDKALRRMDAGLLDALTRAAARSCPA
jgi:aminoglycoside phosphotransferase (APT) family kinase protein